MGFLDNSENLFSLDQSRSVSDSDDNDFSFVTNPLPVNSGPENFEYRKISGSGSRLVTNINTKRHQSFGTQTLSNNDISGILFIRVCALR